MNSVNAAFCAFLSRPVGFRSFIAGLVALLLVIFTLFLSAGRIIEADSSIGNVLIGTTPTSTPTATPTPCASPGSLDTSFNGTGIVTTPIGPENDNASSVAIQSDGKIVAAGSSLNGSVDWDFAVVRYDTDGTLDTTFNGTGIVTTPIGSSHDNAYAVAIQTDGKIIVVGQSRIGSKDDFAVVRYNIDGTLDTSFNGTGIVTTPVGSFSAGARSVALRSDGRLVVAGSNGDFVVVQYNVDGSLDTTFNDTGIVTTPIGSYDDNAFSVAIQSDGRIVAAGSSNNNSNFDFAVVRYNTNGSLDTSFNGTGKVTTPIGSGWDEAYSVAVQSDGRIVAAGRSYNGSNDDFAVIRYNTDGTLDTTFNGTGKVITSFGGSADIANAVAIQTDGKIIVAGYSRIGANDDFAVVRYNTDSTLDTSFNGTGKVTTPIGGGNAYARSVAIQSNGRIVAAGSIYNPSRFDFAVVRYNGASCPSPTPAVSGSITYGNAIGSPNPRFVSNVLLSGVGSPNVFATTGFPNGTYTLTGFGAGAYTVTPTKTGGVNSITSFDAAKIAQHVSGNSLLTGNQLLVADVSGNGTINSFDAARIAQYVAGTPQTSLAGTWKFLPVNRTYASVTSNIAGEDFVALLMGEVSGNWINTGQ